MGGCIHLPGTPTQETMQQAPSGAKDIEIAICAPCSREEAREWAADAEAHVSSALKAANCYAFLVKTGADRDARRSDAKAGRLLAESAVRRRPESGPAHYLNAYLAGLEAENDPLHGLEWVPVIEREALLASGLSPFVDDGGPDRMLGELYLRAPGIPVSIGDVEKAVAHYRRARKLAPDSPENRVGLIEALLKAEETEEACTELHGLLEGLPPRAPSQVTWQKAMELLKHLCAAMSAK